MKHPLKSLAEAAGARLLGDGEVLIENIASIESATPTDIIFVDGEERLGEAVASEAGAIIAGEYAAKVPSRKPLLIAQQPRIAFSRVAAVVRPRRRPEPGIHSTAVVHDPHGIGRLVRSGPHVLIGECSTVCERTSIAAGVYIGARVRIGADVHIAPNVTIYSETRIGDRVVIHAGAVLGSDGFGYVRNRETGRYEKFPQVGRLEIGDDVEIGANCTIDRGALDVTSIGAGTKLDNLVHVGHNVRIGENVVIAGQSGISGSSEVGNDVVLAGQVGIADHVVVGDGVVLAAQCGVATGKHLQGAGKAFFGTPARPLKDVLHEQALLARMARREKPEE